MDSPARSDPSVSVVIPVFNGERTLGPLIARLTPVLTAHASQWEVILVNDGSRDASWEVIGELATRHDRLRGIDLMRNYGQQNAMLCGIRAARYEVIVTLDDDLQQPPEEIPRLLNALRQGYDVAYGPPSHREESVWRKVASWCNNLALRSATRSPMARHASAFRAFRARLGETFSGYDGPFVCIDVLLSWATSRFAVVPVQYERRPAGSSNYTFRALLVHALNLMTGFSAVPLHIASITGGMAIVVGLAVLVVLGSRSLLGDTIGSGFWFLGSLLFILSGAQLLALGILGEYLGRIHFGIMRRPAYSIRNIISRGSGEDRVGSLAADRESETLVTRSAPEDRS